MKVINTYRRGKFCCASVKFSDATWFEIVKTAEGDYTVTWCEFDKEKGWFRVEESKRIRAANGNDAFQKFLDAHFYGERAEELNLGMAA